MFKRQRQSLVMAMLMTLFTAAQADAQPLAELVPDDALIYVGWRGAGDLGPGYAGSHFKAVLEASNIPALLEDFLPRLAQKLAERGDRDARAMGMMTPILSAMWKYPSAFYYGGFEFPEDGGPIPRVAFMCRAGADAPKLLEAIQQLFEGAPVPMTAMEKNGVVTVALGRLPAVGKGVAGNAKFAAAMKSAGNDPVFVAFADVEAVLANVDQGMKLHGRPAQQKNYQDTIANLGLRGLKRVVVTFGFEGMDWATRAYFEAPSPRTGLLALLNAKPLSDDALKLAPKTAAWMTAMRLDLAKVVAEIRATVAKFDPETAQDLDENLARLNKQLGFDVEKDLLAALGDEWVFYTDAGVGGTGVMGLTMVNRPRDAKKLAMSLARLQAMASEMIKAAAGGDRREAATAGAIAMNDLHMLSVAVISYAVDNNRRLPASMAELRPYLGQDLKNDPWGQPYQYFGSGTRLGGKAAQTTPIAATNHLADGKRIVAYMDGSIVSVEEAVFKEQMTTAKLAYNEPAKIDDAKQKELDAAQEAKAGKTGISRKHLADGITLNYLSVVAVAPAWAIEGDALYVGLYPQVVASAAAHVKSGGPSILENTAYIDLRKRLGGQSGASAVSFYDLQQTAGEGYQVMLLLSQFAMGAADMYGISAPAMVIPPLHKLRPHLTPGGGVSWSDATGWRAASLSPFPGAEIIGTQQTMILSAQAFALGVTLPALGSARRTARQMQASTQARGLHMGCVLWANTAKGKFPPDLAALYHGNYFTIEYVISPSDATKTVPPDFGTWEKEKQSKWINANTSYCYIPGLTDDNDSTKVAIFERLHTPGMRGVSVAFNDNHVQWMSVEEASQLIKEQTGKSLEEWSRLKNPGAGK